MPAQGFNAKRMRLMAAGGEETLQCQSIQIDLPIAVYLELHKFAWDAGFGMQTFINFLCTWAYKTQKADAAILRAFKAWSKNPPKYTLPKVVDTMPSLRPAQKSRSATWSRLRLHFTAHIADRVGGIMVRVLGRPDAVGVELAPRKSSRVATLVGAIWSVWKPLHRELFADVPLPKDMSAAERERLLGLYQVVRKVKK